MLIYNNLLDLMSDKGKKPLTVVLGNFDGVHLGHQKLINIATKISEDIEGETLVFTFYPPPQLLFNPNFKLINSLEDKHDLIKQLGVNKFLAIPFTQEFSKIEPHKFVSEILHKKIGVSNVVCGFNYSFGYKGSGNVQDLIRLGNDLDKRVVVMDPFYIDKELVSSTRIRQFIETGSIEQASNFLGYFPKLRGRVIHGNKIGSKIGFPTANILWDSRLLIPAKGVYAVEINIDNDLKKGVANIGYKPTVTKEKTLTIEANIFDFSHDLYNKEIEIIFYKKLRDEMVFSSLNHLREQISEDVTRTKNFFNII